MPTRARSRSGLTRPSSTGGGRRGSRAAPHLHPVTYGNTPSRSGRRATAPLPIRAGQPRSRVMRISDHILPVALFAAGLGLASAYAFDGTRTPGDIAPAVGDEVVPRA